MFLTFQNSQNVFVYCIILLSRDYRFYCNCFTIWNQQHIFLIERLKLAEPAKANILFNSEIRYSVSCHNKEMQLYLLSVVSKYANMYLMWVCDMYCVYCDNRCMFIFRTVCKIFNYRTMRNDETYEHKTKSTITVCA